MSIFHVPDSIVFGRSVEESRERLGRRLARESGVDADVIVPVPDSGVSAAIGYAAESGIPYQMGLIRNHYVGRTFIEPKQSIRDFGVKLKLNPRAPPHPGEARRSLWTTLWCVARPARKIVPHDAPGRSP